jgi:hypothetical protein
VKASYEARLKALSENSNGTPQTGSGSDALQPNCDPAKGGVDIDSCPEFRREGLKATYCMDGGISCSSYLADQARKKTRLLKGDPKLCRELLTATFEYVAFDLPHSLSPKELTEFGDRWVELGTYAGRADFNNDGKDEVLLPVTLKARNSRSCDQQVFVEVNARLEAFPQTPFDQLFRADVECSENFYPFLYKGKTFFETRRRSTTCCWFGFDLLNEVYLVTAHTRSRVCQFKYDDN